MPLSDQDKDLVIKQLQQFLDTITPEQFAMLQYNAQQGAKTPGELYGFTKDSLDFLEHTATTLYNMRYYERASNIFFYLISLSPGNSAYWRGLGACAHAVKNYHTAFLSYQSAVAVDPSDVPAKVFLGELLCQLDNKLGGLSYLKEVVDADTKNPVYKPYVLRAKLILNAHGNQIPVTFRSDKKKSENPDDNVLTEVLKEAVFEPPTFEEVASNPKALALMEEIKAILKRNHFSMGDILKFTPAEYDGLYAVAARLISNKEVEKGMQALSFLMMFQPYSARNLQLAGIGFFMAKQYPMAEIAYEMALAFEPDNPMTLIYAGETQLLVGKKSEAVVRLKRGLELVHTHADAKVLKARAQALLKMAEQKK